MSREHPADSMAERSAGNTLTSWVLLGGDRRLVATAVVVLVFVGFLAIGLAVPRAGRVLTSGDPIETLYQAYVGATVTSVTLVVTLAQLVLSQELGAVGDQRERMEGALAFREDVADVIDAHVSPADPSAFLRALVEAAAAHAEGLTEALDAPDERATTLVDRVSTDAAHVSAALEDEHFGEFSVVSAALDFNYSWKLYAAERLRAEDGDAMPPEAAAALDDLVATLQLFGPAREHFKTLYFQSELIDLSRRILVVAVPAVVVTSATLLYLDPEAVVASPLGATGLVVLVSATSAIALAPFAVLASYVFRIGVVTERTLSIGPFILRTTDRDEELDWSE